jgi:hypothetical protein
MSRHATYRTGRIVLYGALCAVVLWQAWRVAARLLDTRYHGGSGYVVADVAGNVERPGRYRVPEGTSRFELLQVAGLRPTSDISGVVLDAQVDGGILQVDALASPAGLKIGRLAARLELFLGAVQIRSPNGSLRAQQAGLVLSPGDAVVTDSVSQAELSLGPYSRVDLDRSSEVVFDKMGVSEGDHTVSEVFQKAGTCWYRVVYSSKAERMQTLAEDMVAIPGGTGADYMVQVEEGMVRVHVLDGLLQVSRPGGEETLNLAAGQTVAVYGNRPFQVTRNPSDIDAQRTFAGLQRERGEKESSRAAMINFVFCTLPSAYYFVSVRFDNQTVNVVSIPHNTSVMNYAQGFNTLNEAFLLGGPLTVQSLVEQVVSTRVERHCVLEPSALSQIAALVGGMTVDVDAEAAKMMGLTPGRQRIRGDQILTFLKPRTSGAEGSRTRQWEVLRGLYEEFRSGNLSLTAALAQRGVSLMNTNFTVPEIVGGYRRFNSISGWTFRQHALPGAPENVGRQTLFRPDQEMMRQVLFGS